MTMITPLFSGATVTFIDTLKAEPVLRCLKEQQVTILPVTPQVLQHFYRGIAKKLEDLPLGLGKVLDWRFGSGAAMAAARRPGFDSAAY